MGQLELPVTTHQPASYVIAFKATGKAVQEVFGRYPIIHPAVAEFYEIVPIMDWLQRVNTAARSA